MIEVNVPPSKMRSFRSCGHEVVYCKSTRAQTRQYTQGISRDQACADAVNKSMALGGLWMDKQDMRTLSLVNFVL